MLHLRKLFEAAANRLRSLARGNGVVTKPISVGDRHIVTLVELSIGFGGAGGSGEGTENGQAEGKGTGGGAGGKASACPVAVLVVQDGKVRVEHLGT